jgi:DNA-binding transcriptional ArsR family regulator
VKQHRDGRKSPPAKGSPAEATPPAMKAREASDLLKALANENRVRILCELLEGERCVTELERVVGLSQSALSQHLARLRRDRVVTTRRVGKTICYSLSGRETYVMLEALYRLFSAEDRPATELATGASATDGA